MESKTWAQGVWPPPAWVPKTNPSPFVDSKRTLAFPGSFFLLTVRDRRLFSIFGWQRSAGRSLSTRAVLYKAGGVAELTHSYLKIRRVCRANPQPVPKSIERKRKISCEVWGNVAGDAQLPPRVHLRPRFLWLLRRLDAEDCAFFFVRQHVQQPIRSLPHLAHALMHIRK